MSALTDLVDKALHGPRFLVYDAAGNPYRAVEIIIAVHIDDKLVKTALDPRAFVLKELKANLRGVLGKS
jgi:hypothetical protein